MKKIYAVLTKWRGDLATFKGFTGTRPEKEQENATWDEISSLLRPVQPTILEEKKDGQYFVPCALKEAPFVGKTLEVAQRNGEPSSGKMRSKSHVTSSSLLIIDIDGLPETEFTALLDRLKTDKITFLAYTTHSHGREDKPGIRARLCIPLDRPLNIEEYSAFWHGFDQRYCNGMVGKADASGANMYQQQGTWCCHPSRVDKAQSWSHNAGVSSADALVEAGKPKTQRTLTTDEASESTKQERHFAPCDVALLRKIEALLNYIDPDCGYEHWLRVGMAVFNASKGSSEGLALFDHWSSKGTKYKDAKEIKAKWDSFCLDEANPVTIGTLIKMAKDAGADVAALIDAPREVEADKPEGEVEEAALAGIQKQLGLISMSGRMSVFDRILLNSKTDEGLAEKLILYNRSDGKLLLKRALREQFPGADAKKIFEEFLVSTQTVCYSGVEFNPNGMSDNFLNLWVGPTIKPISGECLLIKVFLLEIICDGDHDAFSYLKRYLAHALQKPSEKPGVIIILIGGQGIGKGTLGRILQKIWSATYIQVNNITSVTGSFNASLERAFIVFMDEAIFSGDRRASDNLKSLITEPFVLINEKFQPSRQIRSYHRFIAATNAEHFKNTERDDRRDFTLRVSESRKGDYAYWDELNDEINNGGVEALVHDLLEMDLSTFNVRKKPNTKELLEQKLHSLDHVARWWHDCLIHGALKEDDTNWSNFISTADAIEGIMDVAGGRIYRKPGPRDVVQQMKKLCSSAEPQQKQRMGSRHRGLNLPHLQQARDEFEQYIGATIDWPEED